MKLDRLLGILTTLLQKDRVTAPYLAEKFEVNRRTIGRDIDTLCRAGIPIITYQGAGGGIAIAEGYKLDPDTIVSMREPMVIDLTSHYKESLTPKIDLIKRAVIETKLIEFDYYYEKGEVKRRIEPYYVIFQWSTWYVFGFCLMRQDWRSFKLLRTDNVRMLDESYTSRKVSRDKQDFNAWFTDEIPLKAVFDFSERYKLIESYGMDSFTETSDGLLLEIGFTNKDYVVSWLLGFGSHVKVLEPAYIAEEVKMTAQKIAALYK